MFQLSEQSQKKYLKCKIHKIYDAVIYYQTKNLLFCFQCFFENQFNKELCMDANDFCMQVFQKAEQYEKGLMNFQNEINQYIKQNLNQINLVFKQYLLDKQLNQDENILNIQKITEQLIISLDQIKKNILQSIQESDAIQASEQEQILQDDLELLLKINENFKKSKLQNIQELINNNLTPDQEIKIIQDQSQTNQQINIFLIQKIQYLNERVNKLEKNDEIGPRQNDDQLFQQLKNDFNEILAQQNQKLEEYQNKTLNLNEVQIEQIQKVNNLEKQLISQNNNFKDILKQQNQTIQKLEQQINGLDFNEIIKNQSLKIQQLEQLMNNNKHYYLMQGKISVLHISNMDQYCVTKESLQQEAQQQGIVLELIENRGYNDLYSIDISRFDCILVSTWSGISVNKQGQFLNECAQKGKNIVITLFANSTGYTFPQGNFQTPLIPQQDTQVQNYDYKLHYQNHPIMLNISKITIGSDKRRSNCIINDQVNVQLIASFQNDNKPFIAIRTDLQGLIISIGIQFGTVGSQDGVKLLLNAIRLKY